MDRECCPILCSMRSSEVTVASIVHSFRNKVDLQSIEYEQVREVPVYVGTMDHKSRVAVSRLKKKFKKKNMVAALDTFCPHLPKSLASFFSLVYLASYCKP